MSSSVGDQGMCQLGDYTPMENFTSYCNGCSNSNGQYGGEAWTITCAKCNKTYFLCQTCYEYKVNFRCDVQEE